MSSEILMRMFAEVGAIVTGSHIVYTPKDTGWHHGEAYVNKDVISMHPKLLALCAREMADRIKDHSLENINAPAKFLESIQAVASPAAGAVGWGQMLAHELCRFTIPEPLYVFAEKAPHPTKEGDHIFTFRDIHKQALKGKGVLIAEDISNPGTSARKVAEAVEACGGKVVGVSVLCNRSGQKAHEYLSPYPLLAVTEVDMTMWHEDECPLCLKGIPLNKTLGKAKDWLATEKGKAWANRFQE